MKSIVRIGAGAILVLLGLVIGFGELGHALQGCAGCWVALGVCLLAIAGGVYLVRGGRRRAGS